MANDNQNSKLTPMEKLEREEHRHMGMKAKRTIGNVFGHIAIVLICVIWVIPFVFLFLQSFRTESTGVVNYVLPKQWGLDNYVYLFSPAAGSGTSFMQWYFNTFVIALFVCVLSTAFQLAMAYVLSRFRFKARKFLMNLMLILGMFPGFLTMIILYFFLGNFNLTGNNAMWGLIIVGFASSGMGYYVCKGYFDTVSKSLDEAALIDGATRMQVFFKIILPLCKPIVIYSLLTAFMAPWGDFMFASLMALGKPAGYNVAVGLYQWLNSDQIASHYVHFCTGGIVVSIPVIVLFLFLQRYYVEGVTGGAVKG